MISDQAYVKPCSWCHKKPGQEQRIIEGTGTITVCHDCKQIVDRQLELGKKQRERQQKMYANRHPTKRG